jgi:hypothetical protein
VRGHAAQDEQVGEHVDHVGCAELARDPDRQRLAGELVHHTQHAESTAVTSAVLDEVVALRGPSTDCVRGTFGHSAQTWFARSGRSRTHEPSFSHNRPRFGWRGGTFKPSRRQIRSTRLWLTRQPSARSRAATRR